MSVPSPPAGRALAVFCCQAVSCGVPCTIARGRSENRHPQGCPRKRTKLWRVSPLGSSSRNLSTASGRTWRLLFWGSSPLGAGCGGDQLSAIQVPRTPCSACTLRALVSSWRLARCWDHPHARSISAVKISAVKISSPRGTPRIHDEHRLRTTTSSAPGLHDQVRSLSLRRHATRSACPWPRWDTRWYHSARVWANVRGSPSCKPESSSQAGVTDVDRPGLMGHGMDATADHYPP